MKLTTTVGDPNHWRNFYVVSPEIWIDSVQLHSVIEADDVEGYAIQPQFDQHGHFVHVDGLIQTQRRTGKVRFVGGDRSHRGER